MKPRHELLAVVAFVAAASRSASAQQMLWYADSNVKSDSFGFTDVGPDVDGDGIRDLLVCNQVEDCVAVDEGRVRLCSTVAGELQSWCGDGGWGAQALWVDDIDGGGTADFVVTQPAWYDPVKFGFQTGRVQLMSFETGAVIREWIGGQTDGDFGEIAEIVGDIDGDGYRELMVGQPDYGTNVQGRVWILSVATGAKLRTHDGGGSFQSLGLAVRAVGDVDGDGIDDYALSSTPNNGFAGRVSVRSGATGSVIGKIETTGSGDIPGWGLSPYMDVDGDGLPDLLIGGRNSSIGFVEAFSPISQKVLFRLDSNVTFDQFGFGIQRMGDMDGDGFEEFIVAVPTDSTRGPNDGRIDLVSGRTLRPLFVFYSPVGAIDNYGVVLPGADFDGDQLGDSVLHAGGALFKAKGGHVAIFAGNDLWLQAEPPIAAVGETVVVDLRGAEPGRLGLLALTAIDGAPLFETLLLAPFDANGEIQLSADVDPSWSGMQFTLMAWAENRNGRGPLRDASPFTVSVQ